MRFSGRLLPLVVVLLSASLLAQSRPVTFTFSGTTSYVDPLLSSIVKPGDPITGFYTFDPTTPDTDPSDPTVGLYESATPSEVSVGMFTAQATPVLFNIFDNLVLTSGEFRTQYRAALSRTSFVVNGLTYNGFTLDLWSQSPTPLSIFQSDALPSIPPGISTFQLEQLRFYFIGPNNSVYYIIGDLESLTAVNMFAFVQPPINADGTSIFRANRGTIPVKFSLNDNIGPTCNLPAATISITRTAGGTLGPVDESIYELNADSGSNFRIDSCQYVYNLAASALGIGIYRVDISINRIMVGHAVVALE